MSSELPVIAPSRTQSAVPSHKKRADPSSVEEVKLDVLFQSPEFVIINKPPDVRLDGDFDVTVEKLIRCNFTSLPKPHFVHQLDYATSGVLCMAFNRRATAAASTLFQQRATVKQYLALVEGHVDFAAVMARHKRNTSTAVTSTPTTTPIPIATAVRAPVMANVAYRQLVFRAKQAQQSGAVLTTEQQNLLLLSSWTRFLIAARCDITTGTLIEPTAKDKRPRKKWGKIVTESVSGDDIDTPCVEDGPIVVTPEIALWAKCLADELMAQEAADVERYRVQSKAQAAAKLATPHSSESPLVLHDDNKLEIKHPIASLGKDEFRMCIGTVDNPGQPASTEVSVVECGHMCDISGAYTIPVTLLSINLNSGRRHQIRLHLASIGHSIVGDGTYGTSLTDELAPRMMLHAWKLTLPFHEKSTCELHCPLTVETPNPFVGYYRPITSDAK